MTRNSAGRSEALRPAVLAHPLLRVKRTTNTESKGESTMNRESCCANEDVLSRVKGEFLEMPGMRLTEPQARRLWNLDAASCHALLTELVDSKFLFRTRDGAFMRIEHGRPARVAHSARSRASAA